MNDAKNAMTCGEVRALLASFLADEIPADESLRIQAHIEACDGCARRRRLEEAFDTSLRRAVRRETAPSSLIVRIHEALAADRASLPTRRGSGASSVRRRWSVAAALLLLALTPAALVPLLDGSSETGVGGVVVAAESVAQGTLVCGACERHGVPPAAQKGCRKFGHHAAFKCPRTGLWEIVENDNTRDLIVDADHLGEPVELRGVFLDDLHYVRVRSYDYLH